MDQDCSYYVYVKFRPTGIPCYVGKGKNGRAYRKKRNAHLAAITRLAGGELPTVIIRDRLSEVDAFELEKIFIAAIGREVNGGPLVNYTDGGDGPSGLIHSDETKRVCGIKSRQMWNDPVARESLIAAQQRGKSTPEFRVKRSAASKAMWTDVDRLERMRKSKRERYKDPAERLKTSLTTKAALATKEMREKISAAQKVRFQNPEELAKVRRLSLGLKHSTETIEKRAAANRGKKRTPESRAKMSAWQIGRKMSIEARAKMSASAKARKDRQPAILIEGV